LAIYYRIHNNTFINSSDLLNVLIDAGIDPSDAAAAATQLRPADAQSIAAAVAKITGSGPTVGTGAGYSVPITIPAASGFIGGGGSTASPSQ
jgi:hypothetical protein